MFGFHVTLSRSTRRFALSLVAATLTGSLAARADAAYTVTFSQSGGNVTASGSGTINTTALSASGGGSSPAGINPSQSYAFLGATAGNAVYTGTITGPANFGPGGSATATTGTGNFTGLFGAATAVFVPAGYVSGTALTGTATYNGATFATLGITPGTYVYSWGTGPTADTFTIVAAPEPTTCAVLAVAGVGLLLRRRKRNAGPAAG